MKVPPGIQTMFSKGGGPGLGVRSESLGSCFDRPMLTRSLIASSLSYKARFRQCGIWNADFGMGNAECGLCIARIGLWKSQQSSFRNPHSEFRIPQWHCRNHRATRRDEG